MKRKKQKWEIEKVESKIDKRLLKDENKIISAIFNECVAFAKRAKNGHTYRNYKGELESSVGVAVLKDRSEIKEWSMLASDGTDPSKGLSDYRDVLEEYIIGKANLPDGTEIPARGIAGIVFAAAPYASMIESGQNELEGTMGWSGIGGKKVLNAFAPQKGEILTILKNIIYDYGI